MSSGDAIQASDGDASEASTAQGATAPSMRGLLSANSTDAMAAEWASYMFDTLRREGLAPELCTVFLRDQSDETLRLTGAAPENRRPGDTLVSAASTAMMQKRAVVKNAMLIAAAVPLVIDDVAYGAVGMELRQQDQSAVRAAMQHLHWGSAWMRDLVRGKASSRQQQSYAHAVQALNAVVGVAEKEEFQTAAVGAVTDLATRFDCDRVSIGFRTLWRTRVRAISHTAQFSRRMSLVLQLTAAMEEAIDQRSTVIYPEIEDGDIVASRQHETYARHQSIGHVFTVPLYSVDHFIGAMTFERPAEKPFSQEDLDMLEAVSTVLAPVLDEKRRNDRWLITKIAESLGTQFRRLLGPGRFARKVFVASCIALVAFFWVARVDYKVAANAVVEGAIQRQIVAPFDGFIAEAPASAGDFVTEEDLLVRFDDRELALDRLRLVTLRQRELLEYDKAVAERDRTQTRIRQTQIAQAEAQIELVDEQLSRTRMTAPFDGLVVEGDLSQSIGSSVTRGDRLLTIVPRNSLRVTLQVDERQISDISVGQTGMLRVTALPDESYALRITKITPVAVYGDGATSFKVQAELTDDFSTLRPGMEGAARIEIDERRLIAIWTQPFVDWLRVRAWRYWPT